MRTPAHRDRLWLVAAVVMAGSCTLAVRAAAHTGLAAHVHRPAGASAAAAADPDAPARPTENQIAKRLEHLKRRAEQRRAKRPQRQRDSRKALRRRVRQRLRGGPLTPPIVSELHLHAHRVAWLRQIAYRAAGQRDFRTVLRVDRTLARENTRHEAFWRALQRRLRQRATPGGAAPGRTPPAPRSATPPSGAKR